MRVRRRAAFRGSLKFAGLVLTTSSLDGDAQNTDGILEVFLFATLSHARATFVRDLIFRFPCVNLLI